MLFKDYETKKIVNEFEMVQPTVEALAGNFGILVNCAYSSTE